MNWISIYLSTLLTAFVLGTLFTWAARAIAPRFGLLDRPKSEGHKNHRQATAVAGGIAMWCAWFLTLCMGLVGCALLAGHLQPEVRETLTGLASVRRLMLTMIGTSTLLMAAGMQDDRHPMPAWLKFLIHFNIPVC